MRHTDQCRGRLGTLDGRVARPPIFTGQEVIPGGIGVRAGDIRRISVAIKTKITSPLTRP